MSYHPEYSFHAGRTPSWGDNERHETKVAPRIPPMPPQRPSTPIAPIAVQAPRTKATNLLLALVAVLLMAILVIQANQIALSYSVAKYYQTESQKSHLSPATRAAVQAAYDASDQDLQSVESRFKTSVYNTSSTDSSPKQTVAELDYIFHEQVVIAAQNRAMLKALLEQ